MLHGTRIYFTQFGLYPWTDIIYDTCIIYVLVYVNIYMCKFVV